MQVPEEDKYAAAPAFYRAAWGSRNDNVLLMNATHVWFLDLEVSPLLIFRYLPCQHPADPALDGTRHRTSS